MYPPASRGRKRNLQIPLSACGDARGYDSGPGGQTPPRTGLSELSFLECGLQTTIFLDFCGFKTTILYNKCGLQTTPRITLSITSAEKRLKIATLREIRKILIALPIRSPPMLVCRRFRIVRQGERRCRRERTRSRRRHAALCGYGRRKRIADTSR